MGRFESPGGNSAINAGHVVGEIEEQNRGRVFAAASFRMKA